MKKNEIEIKDQALVKKFRTIIENKERPPAPRAFPFRLIFWVTALILGGMLLLFKPQPEIGLSNMPETSSQGPVPAEPPALKDGLLERVAQPAGPTVLAPARKSEVKETIAKSADPGLNDPIPEQKSSVEPSNIREQADMPQGIQIEEIIACSRVNKRQYSRPQHKFSLAQESTPTVWMKVLSENPPFTLTHVYYFKGRKYCEVPLAIRYPQMRTWSSVTLRSPEHIGKWRVEVIADNGAKLDEIEFTVEK